jgi:hypothetical protein
MASDRQIEANRENARRSTGPRTPLGKARASLNAVRHGLSARNLVLPEEDQEAYLELHASLEDRYPPDGPVETFLVQQMASAQWRLQRLERISTGFVIAGREDLKRDDDRLFQRPSRPPSSPKTTKPSASSVSSSRRAAAATPSPSSLATKTC